MADACLALAAQYAAQAASMGGCATSQPQRGSIAMLSEALWTLFCDGCRTPTY